MKLPYEEFPHIWKNSTAWWNYFRGCLRKAWSTNPVKLEVLKAKRIQIPNPNPKGKKETVWGFKCEMCSGTFPISQGQVDHIVPAGKLSSVEDITGFVTRLLFVGYKDLRLVCKGCNNALAMSDKKGVSYEQAVAAKAAIEICKTKKDKQWLEERGIIPSKNVKQRRQQIEDYLNDNHARCIT